MTSNQKLDNVFIDFDENGNIIVKQRETLETIKQNNITNIEINKEPEPKKQKTLADIIDDILSNEPLNSPYKCTICNNTFVKKSYWKEHVLAHDKKVACQTCGREFMHQTHLNQHMTIHKGPKEHECDICGFKVRFKFNLKKHRKIHIPYRDENDEIKYYTLK